jgi:hypothetical protein
VQLADGRAGRLDLKRAVRMGYVAAGKHVFHLGGVALESQSGERLGQIARLYEAYGQQVAALCRLKADPLDPRD